MTTSTVLSKGSRGLSFNLKLADALAIVSMFAIGGLVYGVFANSLGFYWDDWPVVWVYNALGSEGVTRYFAGQRPAYGWIIAHVAQIIGIAPLGWHILSLAVRCASSAALFIAFSAIWPRRRDFAWLVAALVLLYPGFTLQPIALGFLEYHLSFLLFVVSLTATILSITKPANRWLFVAISLITEAISYFVIEYFIGLEFLRLFVIIFLTHPEDVRWNSTSLKAALVAWSPNAAVWAGYVVWRAFIFRVVSGYGPNYMNVGSHISEVLRHPVGELLRRTMGLIHNILMSSVLAWSRPFGPDLITATPRTQVISWACAAIVVAISIYMLRLNNDRQADGSNGDFGFHRSTLLLGGAGLIFAGLPFVVSGQAAIFSPPLSFDDRFTLSFMLPASILLASLITFLGADRKMGVIALSVMLFAFSAYQIQNGAQYHRVWIMQRSLFWQIAWRAPSLKRGTSILIDGMPRSLYGNHSAGTLDMLYDRDDSAGQLNYFMFDLARLPADELFWSGERLSYKSGAPLVGRVRSFEFQGTTSQSLVAWFSPSGTFRIAAQPNANEFLEGSALSSNLSHLSHPEDVISDAPAIPDGPLLKLLGPEPKDQWLYFYQKAELERQLQHWGAVAELGDEVIKLDDVPKDASEWFPFIDGYAKSHRYRRAAELSMKMLNERPDALEPLTSLWLRVKQEDSQSSPELKDALAIVGDKIGLGDSR